MEEIGWICSKYFVYIDKNLKNKILLKKKY